MKLKFKKTLSVFLTVVMIIGTVVISVPDFLSLGLKAYAKSEALTITAKTSGETLNNKAGYVNTFNTSGIGNYSADNPEAPLTGVIEYIELMNATGGGISELNPNAHDRDLIDINGNFREGKLKELKDAINTILLIDAKPLIKLGSVPFYFTKTINNPTYQVYGMFVNPYPPDTTSIYTSKFYKENGSFVTGVNGYDAYRLYLKDVIQYLINEYGIDEVRTWRWGVDSEYENFDWFHTNADDSLTSKQRTAGNLGNANTVIEFFKLYDYTADAVISMIGDEYTYIGAHAMAVSQGLWDETKFISQHLANPTGNYVTGRTVHCDYIGVSYYEGKVGVANQNCFVGTIENMRSIAKSCASNSSNPYVKNMLNNLRYGVDEGRILNGLKAGKRSVALSARVIGQTWQAAYDARTYYQMINNDIDYFCSWSFSSGGLFKGMPHVTYHVGSKTAQMSGEHSYIAEVTGGTGTTDIRSYTSDEVNAYATYNTDDSTMRVMAYNFKNDLNYSEKRDLSLRINLPTEFRNKSVYVTKYAIDDNANYFDEWEADLTANGISNNAFSYSPDSHTIESNFNYISGSLDPDSREAYNLLQNNLPRYKNAAKLKPTFEKVQVDSNGSLVLTDKDMQANSAVYYEISSELNADGASVISNTSTTSTVIFNVPECIYLTSSTATSGTVGFRYVFDQSINTSTGKIVPNSGYKNIADGGNIEFYCPDAENVRLYYSYGSDNGGTTGSQTVSVAKGSVWNGSNGMYRATISGGNASNTHGYIEYRIAYTINGVSYTKISYSLIYKPADQNVVLNTVDKSPLRDKLQELIETVDFSRLKATNKSWDDDKGRFVQVYKTASIFLGRPSITSNDVVSRVQKINDFLENYINSTYKNDGTLTVSMNMINGRSDIENKSVKYNVNVSKKSIFPGEYDDYTYESSSFEYNLFDTELFVDSLSNATYNNANSSFTATGTTTEKVAHGFWTKFITPVVPGAKYILTVNGSGSGSYILCEGNYGQNSTGSFNGNSSVTITVPSNCYYLAYSFNSGSYNVNLQRVNDSGNVVMPDGSALPITDNGILCVFENKAINAPIVNYTLTYSAVPHTLTVSANGGMINGESSIVTSSYYNDTAVIPAERPVRKGYFFGGYEITGDEKVDYLSIYEHGFTSIYKNFNLLDSAVKETEIIKAADGTYTNYKMYGTGTSSNAYFCINFPFSTVAGDTATITAQYRSRGTVSLTCMTAYNNYSGKTDIISPDSSSEWKTLSVSRNINAPYTDITDIDNLDTGRMSALCIMFRQSVQGKTSTVDNPFMDLDIKNVVITVTHADGTSETVPTSFKMPKNDVTYSAIWIPYKSTVSYDNMIDFDRDFESISNYTDADEKSILVNRDAVTSSNKIQLTEGHSYVLTYDVKNVGTQNNKSGCFIWYGDSSTSYVNTWSGDNKGYSLSPNETQHVEVPFAVTSASTTIRLRFDSHNGSASVQNGKDLGDGVIASGYDLKYYNIRILDLTQMGLAGKNVVPSYNGNEFKKTVFYGSAIGAAPVTPTINSDGYVFDGWFTPSGTKITESTMSEFEEDIMLYSRWRAVSFSISYNLDGGRCEIDNPTEYSAESQSITLNNPMKSGYTFTGWTGTGLSNETQTVVISSGSMGDRSYKANWSVNSYSVLFNANGGVCSTIEKTVTYNTEIGQLPTPESRVGFVFKGWYTDTENGNKITEATLLTSASDVTIFAQWEHDTFKLKANSNVIVENKLLYCKDILTITKQELAERFINTNIIVSANTAKIATGTTLILTDDQGNVYDTVTVIVFGDVNGDGFYDGTDAMIVDCISNNMLTREQTGEAVWAAADCNHDGVIDSFDVQLLQQAGLLLNEVDQTMSTEDLVTNSAYTEYIQLIDQNPETQEIEDTAPTEPIPEQPNQSMFSKILSYILDFFKMILKLFS